MLRGYICEMKNFLLLLLLLFGAFQLSAQSGSLVSQFSQFGASDGHYPAGWFESVLRSAVHYETYVADDVIDGVSSAKPKVRLDALNVRALMPPDRVAPSFMFVRDVDGKLWTNGRGGTRCLGASFFLTDKLEVADYFVAVLHPDYLLLLRPDLEQNRVECQKILYHE